MSTESIPEKSAISAAMNPMLRLKEAGPVSPSVFFLYARNKSNRPANNNAIGKLDMKG